MVERALTVKVSTTVPMTEANILWKTNPSLSKNFKWSLSIQSSCHQLPKGMPTLHLLKLGRVLLNISIIPFLRSWFPTSRTNKGHNRIRYSQRIPQSVSLMTWCWSAQTRSIKSSQALSQPIKGKSRKKRPIKDMAHLSAPPILTMKLMSSRERSRSRSLTRNAWGRWVSPNRNERVMLIADATRITWSKWSKEGSQGNSSLTQSKTPRRLYTFLVILTLMRVWKSDQVCRSMKK